MKKPIRSAEREIVEALVELREERIARIARARKKARREVARFVRF